ncbi:unnamed protein product, partial [Rotaria sordida]
GQQMKSLTSPNTTSAVSNFTTVSSSSSPLSSSTYQQLQDKTDPNEISLAPVSSPTASISFDASTKITTPFITPAQFQQLGNESVVSSEISDIESETEESKTNDQEISLEYDYGVELI